MEEVAKEASKKGLDVISITDHDIMPDLDRIAALSKTYSIKMVPGLEVSTYDYETGKNAHILGYFIEDYDKLNRIIEPLLKKRGENTLWQIEKLASLGYEITEAEVRAVSEAEHLYRQNILYVLWKKGIVDDMFGEWYRTMFKNGGSCQITLSLPETKEVVSAIAEGGGYPVLAHPGQQNNLYLAPRLSSYGLKGIELYHPSNNSSYRKEISDCAKEQHLFFTGGSDYHGLLSNSGGEIGDFYISYEGDDDSVNSNAVNEKIIDEIMKL